MEGQIEHRGHKNRGAAGAKSIGDLAGVGYKEWGGI